MVLREFLFFHINPAIKPFSVFLHSWTVVSHLNLQGLWFGFRFGLKTLFNSIQVDCHILFFIVLKKQDLSTLRPYQAVQFSVRDENFLTLIGQLVLWLSRRHTSGPPHYLAGVAIYIAMLSPNTSSSVVELVLFSAVPCQT